METVTNNYDKIVELYNLFGKPAELREIFYENDYPFPYKSLLFYPVSVDLYRYFHILVDCLLLSKNDGGDIEAISMSYLSYLVYLAKKGNEQYLIKLRELLKICLRIGDKYFVDGKEFESIEFLEKDKKVFIRILGNDYNGQDFDFIKQVICEQNAIELPDPNIHPDILKAYNDIQEYKRKQSKVKMCSFGDQLNVIIHNTAYRKSELMNMSIRTFSHLLERIDMQLSYEIMTLLSPNMDKKGQEGITHYLADKTTDKYKDLMIDYDSFKSKIE